MHKLKKIRLIVSVAFLAMFMWAFLSLSRPNEYFTHTISALQFFPSLHEFMETLFVGGGAGFIIILVLTVFFGRVYCSFLCPLGATQDVVIRLKGQSSKLNARYTKPLTWMHYGVSGIVLLLMFFGIEIGINLLDPFANFGRIMTNLFRPVLIPANNSLSYLLGTFDINLFSPRVMHALSTAVLVYTAVFFGGLIAASILGNRIYCNTLCPVGGILSIVSAKAVYKIGIDAEKCTACGKCESVCKSNCIDYLNKKVDFSRCVACFNCLDTCGFEAISYTGAKGSKAEGGGRREAIKSMGIAGAGMLLAMLPEKARAAGDDNLLPKKREIQVLPPGAKNLKHFTDTCIACHLCVSACPAKVIAPGFLENGISAMLQPRLDYEKSYCNYKCTTCTVVCPAGALSPLTREQKQVTKIGLAKFVKEKCIVHVKKKDCLVCNEYCPTKACSLVPYEGKLKIPKVIENLCIGCGACENRCPARPKKAIYVEGLNVHKKADKPAAVKNVWKGGKEFPF